MSTRPTSDPPPAPVVVVGEFDGFHVGHRELLRAGRVMAERQGRPLVAVVMDDRNAGPILDSADERCWNALAAGATSARVLAVDSADVAAGARVAAEVVHGLDPAAVLMACLPHNGEDARYPALRHELAREHIPVVEVDRRRDASGTPITSARVRAAVASGDIAQANEWLGRPFAVDGEVIHGNALGRTIGFATANLAAHPGRALPARGVYAANVDLADGRRFGAAVNIGVRPTLGDDGAVVIEAHLIDFDEDIYGQSIRIGFLSRLRPEQRFASLDDLVAQLDRDVCRARTITSDAGAPPSLTQPG